MKTLIETIKLTVIFAMLLFGIFTILQVTAPEPPNSSGIEY